MQIRKDFLIDILKASAICSHEHNFDFLLDKTQELISDINKVDIKDGEMLILEIVK